MKTDKRLSVSGELAKPRVASRNPHQGFLDAAGGFTPQTPL